jgi:hypothetical protein
VSLWLAQDRLLHNNSFDGDARSGERRSAASSWPSHI